MDDYNEHTPELMPAGNAADVAPVVHGRWMMSDAYPHRLYCSACYKTALPNIELMDIYNLSFAFCPNCGAKMDGGPDE